MPRRSERTGDDTLPLVEEELRIDKREVATGRVTVKTVTDVSEEIARATLEGETVEVTRVPVGREVEAAPNISTDGDLTIIPVLEEVLVVEKRLMLKEEIHLRRRATREEVEVPVKLRRQRAVMDRNKS